jgi:hypothetical protein
MTRSLQLISSFAVAAALAVPAHAAAQATGRGSGSGTSTGSSGTSSGSGSSGSTTGSGTSSGSSTSRRAAPPNTPTRSTAVRRTSEPSRTTGSASSRTTSSSGSASSSGSNRVIVPGGSTAIGRPGSATSSSGFTSRSGDRDRAGRSITGYAALRPQSDVRVVYYPFVGPWGRFYPWYSSGFGWGGFGYLAYDPYYSPAYYRYPYGAGYGYPYDLYNRPRSAYGYDDEEDIGVPMGSVRLRVSPDTARVYINGALVGTVDDFNGLSDHLQLPAGMHQIEIRAEGYEPYIAGIAIEPGKTQTERFSLKKRQ